MRLVRISIVLLLVAWGANNAWSQTGLYGSPESLQLSQLSPAANNGPWVGQPSATVAYAQGAPGAFPQPCPQPAGAPIPRADGSYWQPTPQMMPTPQGAAIPPGMPPYGPGCMSQPPQGPQCNTGAYQPGAGAVSGEGCGAAGCPWYVSLNALVMTRNSPNALVTSKQANNCNDRFAFDDFDWRWGGELTFGRHFFCGCDEWSLEATYWSLDEFNATRCPNFAGPYNSPLKMDWTNVGDTGTLADEWFNNSPDHQVRRTDEVQNVEINLLRNHFCVGCGQPWNVDLLAGFRFFRFRDQLEFDSQHCDDGGAYALDWIHLHDDVNNNLWGGQIGCNLNYCVCPRWSVFVTPKVGLYDDYTTLHYNLFATGPNGQCWQASSPTYPGVNYPVCRSTNSFAVMTQIDVGTTWAVTPCLGLTIGYRLVAVTGIALADNQVPTDANDTVAISQIDKNGSLILHGAFAGLTYSF